MRGEWRLPRTLLVFVSVPALIATRRSVLSMLVLRAARPGFDRAR